MNKVIITADSTIDFSPELVEKFDVKVIPLHILYDNEDYLDGVDITSADLLKKYEESGKLPTTSAVSVGEYLEFFGDITKDGDAVVHLSLSSDLSSSHQNACTAAEAYEDVHVVDTKQLTNGMGILAVKACDMRDKGYSAKEIASVISEMSPKIRTSFILEKLDFLAKGGRCSSVTAFGANILGIKLSIAMKDGKLGVSKKYRGKIDKCQMQYVSDVLEKIDELDKSICFIAKTADFSENTLENIKKEVKKVGKFENIYVCTAGCTITAHCGKNVMGVIVIQN